MAYAKTKIDVLQKTPEMRAAFDPTLRELFYKVMLHACVDSLLLVLGRCCNGLVGQSRSASTVVHLDLCARGR